MKLLSPTIKDILYVLVLLTGMSIQWGIITTRVGALEGQVKEVSSVKEDISELKVCAIRNYESIKELQRDVKQVLLRLPRP